MKINFRDGSTMEIPDDKIWEVYKAIDIRDYEQRIAESFVIRHKETDTLITPEERHEMAVQVRDVIMDNMFYWDTENDTFQDSLEIVCKNNDCYEGDDDYEYNEKVKNLLFS